MIKYIKDKFTIMFELICLVELFIVGLWNEFPTFYYVALVLMTVIFVFHVIVDVAEDIDRKETAKAKKKRHKVKRPITECIDKNIFNEKGE